MKIVLQRVKKAQVEVAGQCIGSIGRGYLLLLGVANEDTREIAEKYLDKILKLRIFPDEEGKTNCSLEQVQGEILIVPQFTLYADCRKGNRPSFQNAGSPALAKELFLSFTEECKKRVPVVETGEFGADMQVTLVNDGPFTLVLEEW